MNTQTKGLLITTLGVLCVLPDSLFIRLIDADALVIAFWRNLMAGTGVLIGVLAFQGTAPFRAVMATGINGWIYVVTLGASGVLFVIAISLTSVANAVFIIASMPAFAAIFSRVFLSEKISPRMMITIVCVTAGLGVIAYGSGETSNASLVGDVAALLVAASFAAGLTAVRGVKDVSMVPAVPIAYVGAALLILPFVDVFSVPSNQVWMLPVYGGFIVASATLLALGPRYITSAEVALLILLESVLAPIIIWAFLGEQPGRWALIGGALVVGALAGSNIIALRRKRGVKAPLQ
ncbi:DMT family transporter [Shimia thalassica]|uniref:DMT family transporter n=1 Tax=Shimia thalassica TaxID=1715693 RepID=UPI0026E23204|nr:DMT family transporter [Shimia thalassica]MDO6478746.1 DMT family transporter [Shimia thalassica]